MNKVENKGVGKGREISFKTKHVLVTSLLVLLLVVIIIGGGVAVYNYKNYKNKVKTLNEIADRNSNLSSKNNQEIFTQNLDNVKNMDVNECNGDPQCINKVVTAKASDPDISTPDFCNSLSSEEDRNRCNDQFFKEKAIDSRDYTLCKNIIDNDTRDYCYYTIYILTHNNEICSYMSTPSYKDLCK